MVKILAHASVRNEDAWRIAITNIIIVPAIKNKVKIIPTMIVAVIFRFIPKSTLDNLK